MFHEKILAKAADYHSGKLDPPDRAEFEKHLRKCRDCRGLVSHWSLEEPSAGFAERVMARLSGMDEPNVFGGAWFLRWPAWGAVAAAALVVAAFWRPECDWVRADRHFAFSNQTRTGAAWVPGDGMKGVSRD